MQLYIDYLRSTRHLGGLNICLVLSGEALLRVGRKGGFSSRNFYTHLLVRLASAHLCVFFLERCIVQYLGILEKYRGLHTVLGGSALTFDVQRFPEDALKMLVKLLTISAWYGLTVLSDIFAVLSALVTRLMLPSTICWRKSCGILVPWLTDKTGPEIIGGTAVLL